MFLPFALLYTSLLIICGGGNHIMMNLAFLEILSWVFVIFISSSMGLSYLIIQSFFFTLSVVGLILGIGVLTGGLLLKLGIPPFHLWVTRVLMMQIRRVLLFMLTLHKLYPLVFLVKLSNFWLPLIPIIGVFLSVSVLSLGSIFIVLIFSSLLHSLWMMLGGEISLSILLFYWGFYSMISIGIGVSLNSEVLKRSDQGSASSLSWLMLSGLPPFTVFWLKAQVVSGLLNQLSAMLLMIMLLTSMLLMSTYYRVWHFSSLIFSMNTTGFLAMLLLPYVVVTF